MLDVRKKCRKNQAEYQCYRKPYQAYPQCIQNGLPEDFILRENVYKVLKPDKYLFIISRPVQGTHIKGRD